MAIINKGGNFCFGQRVTLWELRKVLPAAKWYKLKCRPKAFPELYAKTDTCISRFYIKRIDSGIFELIEIGSNERKNNEEQTIKGDA
jgi:hypothetical protein